MLNEGQRTDIKEILKSVATDCTQMAEKFSASKIERREVFTKACFEIAGLAELEARNIDTPFKLGIIGMFKAGKSSVLNTFLSRELLKVGRTETTAVLTELKHASPEEGEYGEILYNDGKSERKTVEKALELTDIRSEFYQNLSIAERKNIQESIARITLHLDSPLLKNMVLLDTPGFGGSEMGDKKAFESLSNVDAALVVFSADRVGAYNELEIADKLNVLGREIVALLNKVDDGNRNQRAAKDIEAAESFIRENFKTLVKDKNGESLIYRYSARQIQQILLNGNENGSGNGQAEAMTKELIKWGYLGKGETESEIGVVNFIRERYFSTNSDTQRTQKTKNAHQSILNNLQQLESLISGESQEAASELENLQTQLDEKMAKAHSSINRRRIKIETELPAVIAPKLDELSRAIEEALSELVGRASNNDFKTLIKSLRKNKESEIVEQFRDYFPESSERQILEDIGRYIRRLMSNEWMYESVEVGKLDVKIDLPKCNNLTAEIEKATKNMAFSLGGMVAGTGALIVGMVLTGPIGALLALGGFLVYRFSEAGAESSANRKAGEVQSALRKVRIQIRNIISKVNSDIEKLAEQVNDEVAKKFLEAIKSDSEKLQQEIDAFTEKHQWWLEMKRDVVKMREMVGKLQI